MTRAVIYARFSSDKQTELSIQAQERACREYALRKGYDIVNIYKDEAKSGKGSKTYLRKAYNKMVKDAEAGLFDVVLCHKYDRIARSIGEHANLAARLQQAGVELIAVAQDVGTAKEAKIVKAVLWAMSEYYIDNLAEETRKGLREIAEAGKFTGGVAPFGYKVVDKRYVVDEAEAYWVRRLFSAVENNESVSDIIKQMNACGVRGHRGKPISKPAVYEILKNEKYTGTMLYSPVQEKDRMMRRKKPNAIRVEDAFPALVTKEQWDKVQQVMSKRKQTSERGSHLCSGLVYCSCGTKMYPVRRAGRNSTVYYVCSRHCGRGSIHGEYVDEAVKEYLCLLLNEDNQRKLERAIHIYTEDAAGRAAEFERVRESEIDKLMSQRQALMSNISAGVLPSQILQELGNKIVALDGEIKKLQTAPAPADFEAKLITGWVEKIKKAPTQEAVRLLVERIEVQLDDTAATKKNSKAVKITSTLATLLSNGCGGPQLLPINRLVKLIDEVFLTYIFSRPYYHQ